MFADGNGVVTRLALSSVCMVVLLSVKLHEVESRASDQKEEQQRERGKHEQSGHKGQETPARAAEQDCGEADDEQGSGNCGHEISPR